MKPAIIKQVHSLISRRHSEGVQHFDPVHFVQSKVPKKMLMIAAALEGEGRFHHGVKLHLQLACEDIFIFQMNSKKRSFSTEL